MPTHDSLTPLLGHLKTGKGQWPFAEVLACINTFYHFTPTAFTNGAQQNAAGQNNGACLCFAFAQLQGLTPQQTLLLFAEHYQAVLNNPKGEDHPNIRQFMQHGWAGMSFQGQAITPLNSETP